MDAYGIDFSKTLERAGYDLGFFDSSSLVFALFRAVLLDWAVSQAATGHLVVATGSYCLTANIKVVNHVRLYLRNKFSYYCPFWLF